MHNKKFKVIVTTADIHICKKSISAKEFKYQIKKSFIKKIERLYFIDGIVICGDILDGKTSLNGEYAKVFFWFINKVVKIAKEHGAFIRILKGTHSHDVNQLDNIKYMEEDVDIDFRIIDKKEIEYIDGLKYGYIPEEYISVPKEEYYKEFFEGEKFDFIFGHGMIKECEFVHQESGYHSSKAPILDTRKLCSICKGPILFGHIHTPMEFYNKFYYIGSLLRLCHGEEHDKGWNLVTYLPEEGLYRVDKIVNDYAINFNTLSLDDEYMSNHSIDEIVNDIENFREDNNVDKLSLKINCVDRENNMLKVEILKKYVVKDKSINSSFKLMSEKIYEKEHTEKVNREEIKEFLKLPMAEQIQQWILKHKGKKIDIDKIEKYLIPKSTYTRKDVS